MKKLVKIISIIMILFVLASLCLYRIQFKRTGAERQERTEPVTPLEIKLAQGQISEIDNDAKTLILLNDDQLISFFFDDKTAVSVSGHFVRPTTIASGARVTVKYSRIGNRNLAKEIMLTPSE